MRAASTLLSMHLHFALRQVNRRRRTLKKLMRGRRRTRYPIGGAGMRAHVNRGRPASSLNWHEARITTDGEVRRAATRVAQPAGDPWPTSALSAMTAALALRAAAGGCQRRRQPLRGEGNQRREPQQYRHRHSGGATQSKTVMAETEHPSVGDFTTGPPAPC